MNTMAMSSKLSRISPKFDSAGTGVVLSAEGVNTVSTSVALLLLVSGSILKAVTEAVLDKVPVAAGLTVQTAV